METDNPSALVYVTHTILSTSRVILLFFKLLFNLSGSFLRNRTPDKKNWCLSESLCSLAFVSWTPAATEDDSLAPWRHILNSCSELEPLDIHVAIAPSKTSRQTTPTNPARAFHVCLSMRSSDGSMFNPFITHFKFPSSLSAHCVCVTVCVMAALFLMATPKLQHL